LTTVIVAGYLHFKSLRDKIISSNESDLLPLVSSVLYAAISLLRMWKEAVLAYFSRGLLGCDAMQ
jgi:hypothetical protein